jgi:branched-chain amino acid transport system ATP-binding protein
MSVTPILDVHDLVVSYGKVLALRGASIEVGAAEVVTILGANGAGKSTLLNAVVGVVPVGRGTVRFRGDAITGLSPWKCVDRGIVQVPEGRQIFPGMSVEANLAVAERPKRNDSGFDRARVYEFFPRLATRKRLAAGNLSGGEQQMLAIGRALVAQPQLLLLDEPSLGLSPLLARTVLGAVSDLRSSGIAVLLVEQNAMLALEVADRGYVLANGSIVAGGTADELRGSAEVRRAYLGV